MRAQQLGARPHTKKWGGLAPRSRHAGYFLVLLSTAAVAAVLWLVLGRSQDFGLDFRFLLDPASFDLGDSPLPFQPGRTIAQAFATGAFNTALVGLFGIVGSTVLGAIFGIVRASNVKTMSWIGKVYVESIRNVPLLLQLLFWHTLYTRSVPPPRQAFRLGECLLVTNRGVFIPDITPGMTMSLLVGCLLGAIIFVSMWRRRYDLAAGFGAAAVLCMGGAIATASYGIWQLQCPVLRGFNIQGGSHLSPEFSSVLLALSVYFSSFIAEIVRSGIGSVPLGQAEAARALGLTRPMILVLVVLPQALRLIVPPLTSQYLNLVKGSSLAVVIGYPELIRVTNITTSQTGRAIECMLVVIAIYAALSGAISVLLNIYNRSQMRAT